MRVPLVLQDTFQQSHSEACPIVPQFLRCMSESMPIVSELHENYWDFHKKGRATKINVCMENKDYLLLAGLTNPSISIQI